MVTELPRKARYKPYLEYHHFKAAMAMINGDEYDFVAAAYAYEKRSLGVQKFAPTREELEDMEGFVWDLENNLAPRQEFIQDFCLNILAGKIQVKIERIKDSDTTTPVQPDTDEETS